MRKQFWVVLLFAAGLPLPGQSTPAPKPELPKDPRAILAAAAPFYDYSDPALKPWHLKATYQLYGQDGKPAEQGIYEYWWASPTVFRSTWMRPGATHTDWHTADGKHSYEATGQRLSFFEYKLQAALLSPLPDSAHLDPSKFRLDREEQKLSGGAKIPCIMVIPLMPQNAEIQTIPLGLFPTYCFDSKVPVLRISYALATLAMEFNHLAKTQGRILPMEVLFFEGAREILSAKVESVNAISPADPALTPSVRASDIKPDRVQLVPEATNGMLVKKQFPVYPLDAKEAHISGTVTLHAVIGVDGAVHDLEVVSAPWPSLVASALQCVSRWQYQPYLLNGEPAEVETTIHVIYTLGG
jgi:TonB family protein